MLGVCEGYLSWPFIRGIAYSYMLELQPGVGGVAVAVAVAVDSG